MIYLLKIFVCDITALHQTSSRVILQHQWNAASQCCTACWEHISYVIHRLTYFCCPTSMQLILSVVCSPWEIRPIVQWLLHHPGSKALLQSDMFSLNITVCPHTQPHPLLPWWPAGSFTSRSEWRMMKILQYSKMTVYKRWRDYKLKVK